MKANEQRRNDWDAPITRTTLKKWGDHTGSPGSVPLKPEERLVRVSATVTREDCDRLLALGKGNISLACALPSTPHGLRMMRHEAGGLVTVTVMDWGRSRSGSLVGRYHAPLSIRSSHRGEPSGNRS
jgi:hypothetical protein